MPAVIRHHPDQDEFFMRQAISLALPANTFTDPNGQALTYKATLTGGTALPAWLVFNAATPPERMPHWISHAALYPIATDSARVLRALAPQGSAVAGRLAPTLQSAVTDSGSSDSRADERKPVEKPR